MIWVRIYAFTAFYWNSIQKEYVWREGVVVVVVVVVRPLLCLPYILVVQGNLGITLRIGQTVFQGCFVGFLFG